MVDALLSALAYAGSFLVMAAIFAFVLWRAVRRDRAWPGAAEALGMTYAKRDDSLFESFAGFKVFNTPGAKSLLNVSAGSQSGVKMWLADYRYGTRPARTVEPFGCTLCLLEDDRVDLPRFLLQRRSRPRSFTRAPIVQRPDDDPEVTLDDDEAFTKAFRVETRSPDAVRAVLSQAVRERLRDFDVPYIEVEAKGSRLVVTERAHVEPARAQAFLERAIGILDELRRARFW